MTGHDYLLRQTAEKPLYPELEWSRPVNRHKAGKLLVIGGNQYAFLAPAGAYAAAVAAGIGTCRVLLPDATKRSIGMVLEASEYAPSTPSGSFSRAALGDWLEQAAWSDGVLLAGDLGRNSETAVVVEKFLDNYEGLCTVTKDAADYVIGLAAALPAGRRLTFVLSLAQLQRLGTTIGAPYAFTFDTDLLRLAESLHRLTADHPWHIVVRHLDNYFVAGGGQVSTTAAAAEKIWRVRTAATAAVWELQHPDKAFEALTSAVLPLTN